jgi:LysR family transcriptional regulator for bpeEF and oprC
MKFNGISEFVTTVEQRSFVLAAQIMGMTPSGVSKAVTRLEKRLGTRLLNRSTRRLTLTASGVLFYQRCRQIILGLRDAESLVSRDGKRPRGTLRVDLAPLFGRLCVMPSLPAFATRYPDLMVQVVFRRQHFDLFDEGIDVAVRVGNVSGPAVMNRCIGITRYTTCASVGYLERFGIPQRPEELLQHNCLTFMSSETGQSKDWHFSDGQASFSLSVTGNLSLGNTDGLLSSAVEGFGIVQIPDYMARPAIDKGSLHPLLTNYVDRGRPISIVTPNNRELSAKVKTFIDFVSGIIPEESRMAAA